MGAVGIRPTFLLCLLVEALCVLRWLDGGLSPDLTGREGRRRTCSRTSARRQPGLGRCGVEEICSPGLYVMAVVSSMAIVYPPLRLPRLLSFFRSSLHITSSRPTFLVIFLPQLEGKDRGYTRLEQQMNNARPG